MENSPYLHEVFIQKLKVKKQLEGGEFTDIVISCEWDLHTWHKEHPSVRHGVTNTTEFTLPSDDGGEFIPFEELSKETVVGWIEQYTPNFDEIKTQQELLPSLQFEDDVYKYVNNPFSLVEPEVEPEVE
jgi:hypothetical protein